MKDTAVMTRKTIALTAAALALSVASFVAGSATSGTAAPPQPVIRFGIGGQVADTGNSAGVASGTPLTGITELTGWVVASGTEPAVCRITVDGKPVSEASAVGAGKKATCVWRR